MATAPITEIVLPTRPQPDTIVSIFLLRTYGADQYPGVTEAKVAVDPNATEAAGKLLIDVGGGEFDHHETGQCATELVAAKLGVDKNPELKNLITYARRDDAHGKGTVSKDLLDRTFGLSGLTASLNKLHTDNPQLVVESVLPLIEAHVYVANEHYVELPKLAKKLEASGELETHTTKNSSLKVVFVTEDHVGLAGYLRAKNGGAHDVIVQRRTSGHVNILTKQNTKIDLSRTMAMLRLHEANLREVTIEDEATLFTTGTHEQIPNWYYDPATNSLLNGGVTPEAIEATKVAWDELKSIVTYSLEN